MHKNYTEINIAERQKVVVTRIDRKFTDANDAQKVLDVLNENRGLIGLTKKIAGRGAVLGNVIILDVKIPLASATNKANHYAFNMAVSRKLVSLFGRVNVGVVADKPTRKVTVTLETSATDKEVLEVLKNIGTASIA